MENVLSENSVVWQAVGGAFGEGHVGPLFDLTLQVSDLAQDHTRRQAFWRESEVALMRADIFWNTGLVQDDEWGEIRSAQADEYHACAGDEIHLTNLIALMMTHLRGPRLGRMFAWLCGLRDPEILSKAEKAYKSMVSQVACDCMDDTCSREIDSVVAALREAHDGKEVGV